jgi:hypothetical protein
MLELENRCTGNRTEGSNPCLSTSSMQLPLRQTGILAFQAFWQPSEGSRYDP